MFLGLATNYFKIDNLQSLKENYVEKGIIEEEKFEVNYNSEVIQNIDLINPYLKGIYLKFLKI